MNNNNAHEAAGVCARKTNAAAIQFKFTDFRVFPIVMKDEKICRKFLELVLGKKIGKIRIHQSSAEADPENPITDKLDISGERAIIIAPHLKSVRLDVFVIDENAWYNIEMQCTYEPELPKRSRCYQSEIDVENLAKGAGYHELKPCYVIFICTFDPFGRDQPVYTFRYREDTLNDLQLGDETCKIFLNTSCSDEKIPMELRSFFHYVRSMNIQTDDELVSAIHDKVLELNSDDRRSQMHTLEDYINERERAAGEKARAEGLAEGIAEGEARGRAEGEKVGEAKGETAKQIEIARRMLAKGLDSNIIREVTGISDSELSKL
jgi:predicted transposase/invertase (TIGR01784 family)